MRSIIWGVLMILIPCMVPASQDTPPLTELTRKAKIVEGKYRAEEKKLYDIDGEIYRIQENITRVKKDVELKQEQANYLEKEIQHYQSALDRHEAKLQDEWIGLYKGSFLDIVDFYCSHAEYIGYLNRVMEHNYEVLKEYRNIRTRAEEARGRLDDVTQELKHDLTELEDTVDELDRERKKKAKMLASLKRESERYQDKMDQLLDQIEKKKRDKELKSANIFKKKGTLPWPVHGKIVRDFGTFRVKGIAQRSQGIDIEAEEGAPVRSIFAGKVVFVDWMNKYGNTIIIDHGGGYYSVYGHLQKFVKSMGENVSAQETIARVGQSGDVLRPTLHFELRFKDKPQDPDVWLARE
jgi:septal ring factor EnvC (AmiA/AmiB activator)